MKYGWITINITDMWHKPKYNSERVNQLLFSDFVKISDEKNNFYHVEKIDGYIGWVDKRFIALCSMKTFKQFSSQCKYIVTSKTVNVHNVKEMKSPPHFLYYGTTFNGSKLNPNRLKISLPDKTSLIVSSSGAKLISNKTISASEIIKEAKKFLSVPYLWGGVTSVGIDCSGFTQTVLSRFGIQIPRDTKDQINFGDKIPRENIKTGDLLFFNRHVGFAIGSKELIHSSVGGGGVSINSLVPKYNEYRRDLDESFKTARRIF